jgi:hypothetical protein
MIPTFVVTFALFLGFPTTKAINKTIAFFKKIWLVSHKKHISTEVLKAIHVQDRHRSYKLATMSPNAERAISATIVTARNQARMSSCHGSSSSLDSNDRGRSIAKGGVTTP